ncbi:PEP/pyruvate-binding domain-containing protein [Crossiella sp. CA-258035]|uniref:PEP/pyruvate-binding domain-containing protein n=1 Tax=Crossiella sp. CA-258035 TaxID=2981138 RepID=UPI0024BD33B9|nr:PEP/pyruvate-binding domain-containing protein [Crossiella sp. CA-258035]WHT17578.1 PEP/pyruvate-binding domain-containing protein [Crossiella sp. CA-258035]
MSQAAKSSPLVLDLGAIQHGQGHLVGGKAANLASMINAGLRVPDGFCLTTEAYRRAADDDGVRAAVDALSSTNAPAAEVRTALLARPAPEEVAAAVLTAYRELGAGPVAVRSSATAEDLPWASFAGQQETFLHVLGEQEVLTAVRRCWASLWTDRAVDYRAAQDIDHREVTLAVVVQRMVPAAVAGVLFTADPITGRRDCFSVDASPGLGEAVVSGLVNPDHYVLDADGRVLTRVPGDKGKEVRPVEGGGVEVVETSGGGECLDEDALRRLADAGREVQAHFGAPQDVEWALDAEGLVWLTQSRPITTLFPLPVTADPDTPRAYLCYSMVWQGMHGPLTPMGRSAFRLAATGMARLAGRTVPDPERGPAVCAEAGGRIMLDLTPALTSAGGRAALPGLLTMVDDGVARLFTALTEDPRFALRQPSKRGLVRALLRIALRANVPARVFEALVFPASARRRVRRTGERYLRRFEGPANADARERLAAVQRILLTALPAIFPRMVPVSAVGGAMLGIAVKLLGERISSAEVFTLLRGLPHNVTTEMDLALWRLAEQAGEAAELFQDPARLAEDYRRGELPPKLQHALAGFLAEYGHRCVAEIDLGAPRWSEDPAHILGVVGNYLATADPAHSPERHFAEGAAAATAMARELVARARTDGRLSGAVVRFALRRTRELMGYREITKFYTVALLDRARRQLRAVGDELAERGVLAAAEDVFFLDLAETRAAVSGAAGELRARIEQRRAEYQRESRRRQVPKLLLSDGTEPAESVAGQDGGLRGTGASPGTVTGPARVVFDPVGAKIAPGDVLVAPSTDPGWTPLFLTAAGVVLETGGVNSHGAVVAREYGIPAVVGVSGVTGKITDGQTVTVDGTAGVVKVD